MEENTRQHAPTIKELSSEARKLEVDDFKKAIAIYLKLLKRDKYLGEVYNRIMIVYRKQKLPQKELDIIDKAIKAFSELHQPKVKGASKAQVTRLSNSLSRALGLVDKKGVPMYDAEPIAKWKQRKALLEKKINKL
ncbi:MAG: hypothetical protein EOP51_10890 [Sphingobacteriales bacterium]|nr:MAG: hypothetical protein EOP51_10890 [Sphingobacteriales bacterium]